MIMCEWHQLMYITIITPLHLAIAQNANFSA